MFRLPVDEPPGLSVLRPQGSGKEPFEFHVIVSDRFKQPLESEGVSQHLSISYQPSHLRRDPLGPLKLSHRSGVTMVESQVKYANR
jgi:hypothetical protein